MISRRINPIVHVFESGQYDLLDALLSLPISGFLLLGVLGLKRLLLKTNEALLALETFSQLDPLTNSLSRTEILYRITEEIDRSRRNKHSFALLEIDIDHFKNVNDQYGHHVGDEVLTGLVRLSKEALRSIDMIGRIGGEEFLILLPETEAKGAAQIAERLREYIANAINDTSAPTPIKITISVGVTIFNPNENPRIERGIALNELIQKADLAMYQAKNGGRNRVAFWSASIPTLKKA
ncbi:GGDEF domain-containing protein [Polynucleobacter sp. AP-Elch-400A-B2]|uniref:GGDEF domain-containing protein n=1 Tax=Polynucleobacter sp. AP-Elch-400A-B2 TaxID=2576930 RepID=UPI001BFEDD87|nr:GGDEF domain-containing protein [Polynucleobacter sp. AP-Elch-400A-B2]QWE25374.1 GGDEF domain-containing protein [Polynucleobacter sp. AP-Elch-400A-B2]